MAENVIATIVANHGPFRATLHKKFLKEITGHGHKLVATLSADVDPDLANIFKESGAYVMKQEGETFGSAFRQSARRASEIGSYVTWLEPERYNFVKHVGKMTDLIENGPFDVVLPCRKEFNNYTEIQEHVERRENKLFYKLTGRSYDIGFGIKTFKRELTRYFTDYDSLFFEGKRDIWDAHTVPLLDMVRDGVRMGSIEVDYTHPREQRMEEEGNMKYSNKRMFQLDSLSRALIGRNRQLEDF